MRTEQVAIPTYVGLHDAVRFVLNLLETCSVCTAPQVGRLYQHTSRPHVRAWEVLRHMEKKDMVESHRPALTKPAVYRFSKRIRHKFNIPVVRWNSRLEHRLAITDVYLDLGRPNDFVAEPRIQFIWRNETHTLAPDAYAPGMFIEVQRSYVTAARWMQKRRLYEVYFGSKLWECDFETVPKVVIVQSHNQQHSTIGTALNYDLQIVHHISEVIPWAGSDSSLAGQPNL